MAVETSFGPFFIYLIGVVSSNSSMEVCNMGISHFIWRVSSIPWMRWKVVKPVAFLGDVR
jgi:hypothetical protein